MFKFKLQCGHWHAAGRVTPAPTVTGSDSARQPHTSNPADLEPEPLRRARLRGMSSQGSQSRVTVIMIIWPGKLGTD